MRLNFSFACFSVVSVCMVLGVVKSGACFEPDSAAVEGGSAENDALIRSLDAAVAQWLHDVEFVCNYRYVQARAATAEDGLAGKFGLEFKDQRVSGVFNKALGKMRVSRIYEREPLVTSQSKDEATVAFVDLEEVANATMALSYNPLVHPDNPRGSAVFSSRDLHANAPGKSDGAEYSAGPTSLRHLSPLGIAGGRPGHNLIAPPGATSVSRAVVSSTPDSIVVEVSYVSNDVPNRRRVEFSLKWSTPVVVAESLTFEHAGKTWRQFARAFDFVEAPGGPVARRVCIVSHLEDARHAELPWFAIEWVSEDLGTRQPAEDDFLVPIVANTRIMGLQQPDSALRDGKLDIDLASAVGLAPGMSSQSRSGSLAEEEPPRSSRGRWLAGAGLVACVGLFLAVWFRRKGRRSGG